MMLAFTLNGFPTEISAADLVIYAGDSARISRRCHIARRLRITFKGESLLRASLQASLAGRIRAKSLTFEKPKISPLEDVIMDKFVSIEFSLGLAASIALYILDKSGKGNALVSALLLVIAAVFFIHPALSMRWIWSSPEVVVRAWRAALVVCTILFAITGFAIWTWPRPLDLLEPANDPTPELDIPPGRPPGVPDEAVTIAKGEMILFLGKFAVSTAKPSFVVLRLYGRNVLSIKRIGAGISVSADVCSEDGKIFATIEDNKFRINPNNTLPLNRPDPHTLIVEDEKKSRVLFVRFINASTIRISGVFRAGGKYPVIIDEENITFGPLLVLGGIALHVQGRSIFDWPGEFPNQKSSPDTKPPSDKAVLRLVSKDNTANVVVQDSNGDEYSVFQIGGPDVPSGTDLWPAFEFKLRAPGSY